MTRKEASAEARDSQSPPARFRPPALPLKGRILAGAAGLLASSLIRVLGRTWRCQVIGREHYERLIADRTPFIIAVWHDNIMAPIFWHRGEGIKPMVSHHLDGEMIARTLSRLGYRPIRGSSTRGGSEAFAEMVGELSNGHPCSVMPDGPRGPRHVFKPGTILIAGRAGASLLPLTFDAAPKIVFNSWDRLKLPGPFARVSLRYGVPIKVPAILDGEELDRFRERVEADLNALDEAAESDIRSIAR
ncbi:MAG: lysophospholipid acyltransferase family protein [Acidobacteriota bacterium]